MELGGVRFPALRVLNVIYAARLHNEPRRQLRTLTFSPIVYDVFTYGDGMAGLWTQNVTVVNIEHDMQFGDALVADLLSCPHPLCTHAYQMHQDRDYWAHGWLPREPGLASQASCVRWIDRGEEWVDYSALGFCKITPEARRYDLAENIPWMALEQEVNAAVAGTLWHVHWPGVNHFHYQR